MSHAIRIAARSHIGKLVGSNSVLPRLLFAPVRQIQYRQFSLKGKRPVVATRRRTPPPAAETKAVVPIEECWVDVVDKASGQIYYWNTATNETTALGAPKPTGPTALGPAVYAAPPQQSGGIMSGLGGVVAQGMAFGVGSSIAHSVVGSIFGGGHSHDAGGGGGGGDDDFFDL